jgi:hypothetical protein
MKKLFESHLISKLAQAISNEFENRNLFPLIDFIRFLEEKSVLGENCQKLQKIILLAITHRKSFNKLLSESKKSAWIRSALEFGTNGKTYDLDLIATHLCIYLVQEKATSIDRHIDLLDNNLLSKELNIPTDDNLLIDLSNKQLKLENHGIFVRGKTLVYPHQFLRRFYSANFVGMPPLLNKAFSKGLSVKLRIDPVRQTISDHYREIVEFDLWHGPKFSKQLLMNKHLSSRTQHISRVYYCFSYDPKFTTFRTKMMDKDLREFSIEEYCPLNLPFGNVSPGVGDKYCIQKFAHFTFDQNLGCITHLDGAVRVFEVEKYAKYFELIESGLDVEEKIGSRHKMFLVEGRIDDELAQEMLTEWFRYNPHIQEYFSGTTVEPTMTFSQYDEIVKKTTSKKYS